MDKPPRTPVPSPREMVLEATVAELEAREVIEVVFDAPPGPSDVSGRFVEVEDGNGHSISVGEWVHRVDGYWALRFTMPKVERTWEEERADVVAALRRAIETTRRQPSFRDGGTCEGLIVLESWLTGFERGVHIGAAERAATEAQEREAMSAPRKEEG